MDRHAGPPGEHEVAEFVGHDEDHEDDQHQDDVDQTIEHGVSREGAGQIGTSGRPSGIEAR